LGKADENRKIDEPKTPYVRYDAENDLVLGGELVHLLVSGAKADDKMFLDLICEQGKLPEVLSPRLRRMESESFHRWSIFH